MNCCSQTPVIATAVSGVLAGMIIFDYSFKNQLYKLIIDLFKNFYSYSGSYLQLGLSRRHVSQFL